MAPVDPFKRAEDEYFHLKGQFATGRITNEQFEAALKELMVDYEGHYWTIGAERGKWFYFNGQTRVEAEPPVSGGMSAPEVPPSRVTAEPPITVTGTNTLEGSLPGMSAAAPAPQKGRTMIGLHTLLFILLMAIGAIQAMAMILAGFGLLPGLVVGIAFLVLGYFVGRGGRNSLVMVIILSGLYGLFLLASIIAFRSGGFLLCISWLTWVSWLAARTYSRGLVFQEQSGKTGSDRDNQNNGG
jgi:hypothetical protein